MFGGDIPFSALPQSRKAARRTNERKAMKQ